MNTDHLVRISTTLNRALECLAEYHPDDEMYDLFRNAAIKSFELGLESGGKALRRELKAYVGSTRTVDALTFNDVLRQAAKHEIISGDESERWLIYRANRNTTAHDYGERFANETLKLLPNFSADLHNLAARLSRA